MMGMMRLWFVGQRRMWRRVRVQVGQIRVGEGDGDVVEKGRGMYVPQVRSRTWMVRGGPVPSRP